MKIRPRRIPNAPPGRSGPTILQVNGNYLPEGESWIYDQTAGIERYRVVIAARNSMNLERFAFEPVYSLADVALSSRLVERSVRWLNGRSIFFSQVARVEDAAIMHAHGGRTGAFIARTAKHLGIPLVTSFYGADMWSDQRGHEAIRKRYSVLAGIGSRFLVEGPAAAAQLVRLGFPAQRIVVHRLGVSLAKIPFRPRSLKDGRELRVLMAARFMNKKGLPYGAEAFARVAKENPSMRLTIVGRRNSKRDDRIAGELQLIARTHGVEGQIDILGFATPDDLIEIAAMHHLFLQPSVTTSTGDAEGGHPVTLTLLAATGMPMLGTRHCDIPEIVQDGSTGWLVDEKDINGLEAVLRQIVRLPSEIEIRGRNARRLVEEKYDLQSTVLDTIYDAVVKEHGDQRWTIP